jgi:hypothetical protein
VTCEADDRNGNVTSDQIDVELRVADGLVGHWEFNGDGTDSSGNGHDGAFNGVGPTEFEPDRLENPGGAARFVGTNNLQIPDADTLDLPRFTLAAWVAIEVSETRRIIISKRSDNGLGNYTLEVFADSNGRLGYAHDTATGNFSGGGSDAKLPVDRFIHVALVMTGDQVRSFVDGLGQTETVVMEDAQPLFTDIPLFIGAGAPGSFLGLIDDVRIYDRALSDEEVEALANGTL